MAFIVFTYSAKPGMTSEFERFLLQVDQPKVRELPSVRSVRIFRLQPAEPFSYVEVVEVTARAEWDADHERPDVQAVVRAFEKFGDVQNVRVYDADVIYEY